MKLLKIFSAVLFFYILSGSKGELIAQTNVKSKSTLLVGESLNMDDFANGLTSENGKYRFSTNTRVLTITNTENNKHIELLNINSANKFISEIKVTEGIVTILTIENKNPGTFPEEYGPKEVFAKWGDESKGGKGTKLIMQDDAKLVLYGGNGDVLWSSGIPHSINH